MKSKTNVFHYEGIFIIASNEYSCVTGDILLQEIWKVISHNISNMQIGRLKIQRWSVRISLILSEVICETISRDTKRLQSTKTRAKTFSTVCT